MAKVVMQQNKVTKGTVRFEEIMASDLDSPVIGTLYVPKPTLKNLGWSEGKNLNLTVTVAK